MTKSYTAHATARGLVSTGLITLQVLALAGCDGQSAANTDPPDVQAACKALEASGAYLGREDGKVLFVDFYHSRDAERALPELKHLPDVKVVVLSSTHVADDDLKFLRGLKNLENLALNNSRVTDEGMLHLSGLSSLRILNLNECKVSDAGVEQIKGLSNLEKLYLHDTNVTDEGLKHLEGMTNLDYVTLSGSQVTAEGVERLREALPDAQVVFTERDRATESASPYTTDTPYENGEQP